MNRPEENAFEALQRRHNSQLLLFDDIEDFAADAHDLVTRIKKSNEISVAATVNAPSISGSVIIGALADKVERHVFELDEMASALDSLVRTLGSLEALSRAEDAACSR